MNSFDWNGNGHRDIGDSYIDYELSNCSGGGSGNEGSGGGSGGDGCFTTIGAIAIILAFLYLLGACS